MLKDSARSDVDRTIEDYFTFNEREELVGC